MNSGKKNAFSCLFYMHRYEPLTVARVESRLFNTLSRNVRKLRESL